MHEGSRLAWLDLYIYGYGIISLTEPLATRTRTREELELSKPPSKRCKIQDVYLTVIYGRIAKQHHHAQTMSAMLSRRLDARDEDEAATGVSSSLDSLSSSSNSSKACSSTLKRLCR